MTPTLEKAIEAKIKKLHLDRYKDESLVNNLGIDKKSH